MRRTYHAGDIEYHVDVTVAPGTRMRWSYVVPLLDLRGESDKPVRGVEPAFAAGERAAHVAIETALGG